jgi:hypothetical protein
MKLMFYERQHPAPRLLLPHSRVPPPCISGCVAALLICQLASRASPPPASRLCALSSATIPSPSITVPHTLLFSPRNGRSHEWPPPSGSPPRPHISPPLHPIKRVSKPRSLCSTLIFCFPFTPPLSGCRADMNQRLTSIKL